MEKEVILQRKQPTEFVINYPYGERGNKEIKIMGTRGERISEKAVPLEIFEWLQQYTRTFEMGELLIKETDDEEINYIKENIEDVEKVEESAFTVAEIKAILETGNHLTLKKKLKELIEDKNETLTKSIKRQFVTIAGEVGVDSSAKRKIISEWADIDFEISDVIFDNNISDLHK